MAAMDWGMNTDVGAVFEQILAKAVSASLKPADMVKTLFIFSVRLVLPIAHTHYVAPLLALRRSLQRARVGRVCCVCPVCASQAVWSVVGTTKTLQGGCSRHNVETHWLHLCCAGHGV